MASRGVAAADDWPISLVDVGLMRDTADRGRVSEKS